MFKLFKNKNLGKPSIPLRQKRKRKQRKKCGKTRKRNGGTTDSTTRSKRQSLERNSSRFTDTTSVTKRGLREPDDAGDTGEYLSQGQQHFGFQFEIFNILHFRQNDFVCYTSHLPTLSRFYLL